MNLSLNKIREYNIDVNSQELDDMLTQLGHEVETVDDLYVDKLVVGEVLEKEKHPDADKLNIAKVDVGKEVLQIVCGAPNLEKNQKVIVALIGAEIKGVKIAKVELKGIESSGMICSLAELGLNKNVLNSKDVDGICPLPSDAQIGSDACMYLGMDDEILDISLTADRGDCQNYQGIINDLKGLLCYESKEFQLYNETTSEVASSIENPFDIQCTVEENKYFSHLLIEGVTVKDSLLKKQIELMKNNIRPQNNVVDTINLSMLEYGLPLHGYDADTIKGKLEVRKLQESESFLALDEKEYKLEKGTQVICDDEKIVAIAGVIGSNATKITTSTTRVLLESAIFDSYFVRISAKSILKKTDASIRFEKGVDQSRLKDSVNYVVNELMQDSDIEVSDLLEINNLDLNKRTISIDFENVRNVLGIAIDDSTISEILKSLDFEVDNNVIRVPFARHDINYQNDIAEEIIRIYSIDNVDVEESYETINVTNKLNDVNELSIRKVEDLLLSLSLDQTITYSLTSMEEVNYFSSNTNEPVQLLHPISSEKNTYRKSLAKSLIDVALYNFKRMQNESKIFEIGNIYYSVNSEIVEETKIAGLLSGLKGNYYQGDKRPYNFFDLKAIVQSFFKEINLSVEFAKMDIPIAELNPYANSNIIVDGKVIGYLGQVHIDLLGKHKYPMFIFEIDYSKINIAINSTTSYEKINEYPSIERDLTLNGGIDVEAEVFDKLFREINYLEIYKLMDIYIKGDSKAFTYKLTFTSKSKTLTMEEIDEQINVIIRLANKENIKL